MQTLSCGCATYNNGTLYSRCEHLTNLMVAQDRHHEDIEYAWRQIAELQRSIAAAEESARELQDQIENHLTQTAVA